MALTLPYPSLVFVPLDILTADQMNEIVANYEYIANQFPIASSNIDLTTLFDEVAGSSSPITLSDSAANYTKLLIQYRWKDDQTYVSSTIIDGPDGKVAGLVFVHALGGYGTFYLASAEVSISGTSITWLRNGQAAINNNSNPQTSSGASILITKVIGIK